MTGTVESGTLSEEIIKTGHGEFIRYPVHQGIDDCTALYEKYRFSSAIAYHTKGKNTKVSKSHIMQVSSYNIAFLKILQLNCFLIKICYITICLQNNLKIYKFTS